MSNRMLSGKLVFVLPECEREARSRFRPKAVYRTLDSYCS